jgi:PII-like signaling protein
MILPEEGQLLRIFVGESDRYEGLPLYEWLVRQARQRGLAGATVLRGIAGFGAASRIHTTNILRLSLDLPIIIEIVDKPERIEAFLPLVDAAVKEGMVTTEKAYIKLYRAGAKKQTDAPSGE